MSSEVKEDAGFATKANSINHEAMPMSSQDKTEAKVTIVDECLDEDEDDIYDRRPCVRFIERLETAANHLYLRYRYRVRVTIKLGLFLAYMAYFSYCMYHRFGDEGSIVLLAGTVFFVMYLCNKLLNRTKYTLSLPKCLAKCTVSREAKVARTVTRYALYVLALIGLLMFLIFAVLKNNPRNSQSALGIVCIILLCFIISKRPSRVNWHPIFWGFILQFVFATFTMRTKFGYDLFKWLGDLMQTFLNLSDRGSEFVVGKDFKTLGFAFSVIGAVTFFNAMLFLLNHWGVLEVIVVKLGQALSLCLETGPVESVVAAANIFMSLTEAPLLIRPYIVNLSKSELCAVLTCGFASVSGGILSVFVQLGAPADHLITASVISAPAGLAISKLVYPETERVNFATQTNIRMTDDTLKSKNALTACLDGAMFAIKIIAGVIFTVLAVISIMTMLDAMLDWLGQRAGISGLSFSLISSYVLYPLAYAMGADPEDCRKVATLIGVKLVATPIVAYRNLGALTENRATLEDYIAHGNGTWHWSGSDIILNDANITLIDGVMSERSEVIAAYAMCGMSAFPAIGLTIGIVTAMSPSRKQDIIELVLPAFIAGNLANFATAAVAGLLFTESSVAVAP